MEEVCGREARAPGRQEMRPFEEGDEGFPVHPDLEERMLAAEGHPDPVVAHALAVCSAYAYAGPETVSMIMARMGLLDNTCRMAAVSVDAMFLHATAFVVRSRSGRVAILCYRGTEPVNLVNWLVNLDLEPERIEYGFGGRCGATVHGGFYRNTRAVRYEVANILKEMGRLEALYITGHSLGGAMAGLMAAMIRHEDRYRRHLGGPLRAVYTFGQPMVGDPDFAQACQEDPFLNENVVRYVYADDVVPHLPPSVSGSYRHFGREYGYRVPLLHRLLPGTAPLGGCAPPTGTWTERTSPSGQAWGLPSILLAGTVFLTSRFRLTRSLPHLYSVEDHWPRRYVTALTPHGMPNEYGS